MGLIETVPNVSEGRRRDVMDELAAAVRRVDGVRLLDVHADPAHHRSVFTIVGSGAALKAAVLALAGVAVSRIDLRSHQGEHPRMGAVDVVPFIPLEGATMDECVALAREVGAALADRFELPVYLYEAAATSPARANLADVRRGQFEGLAGKMTRPGWAPDFGPRAPHPSAGATAVGARKPLIAYNITLATDRLDVARAIAAAVRHSSGGLPFVKALGIRLADRGVVQVSMNLTDHEQTPMTVVFDAVTRAAARHGVDVIESEIVGLVPQAALDEEGARHIRLRGFSPAQVLETRLRLE